QAARGRLHRAQVASCGAHRARDRRAQEGKAAQPVRTATAVKARSGKSVIESLRFRHVELDLSRPYLVGILNVTPDSFSDGGQFESLDAALARAEAMEREGADWIDVGGESTRPRAEKVSAAEERRRVVPVIEALAQRTKLPLSVDTYKAEVAEVALAAGA